MRSWNERLCLLATGVNLTARLQNLFKIIGPKNRLGRLRQSAINFTMYKRAFRNF